MSRIEITEATSDLRGLVERARGGEDVVLTESGRECARLIPFEVADVTPMTRPSSGTTYQPVKLGRLEGRFKVPDDFDAPLPDDLLDLFEGRP